MHLVDDIFADFCHCASLFPSTMSDDGEEPALGMGQMDDAEPEGNETGAVRDYVTPSNRYQPY